jgi:peptidoglycan glycosyltransferase
MLDDHVLRCAAPRADGAENGRYTWADMGRLRCPAPLQALGRQLGDAFLEDTFERFGLTQAPPLIIPAAGGPAPEVTVPEMAAIGQESLTVTPLQAALATAALASEGRPPLPRLVEATRDPAGQWQPWPATDEAGDGVSPEAAEAVRGIWPESGDIAEFTVSALAGPGGERVTWYLGFAPAGDPRHVLALVLENERDLAAAEAIGRAVLGAAE